MNYRSDYIYKAIIISCKFFLSNLAADFNMHKSCMHIMVVKLTSSRVLLLPSRYKFQHAIASAFSCFHSFMNSWIILACQIMKFHQQIQYIWSPLLEILSLDSENQRRLDSTDESNSSHDCYDTLCDDQTTFNATQLITKATKINTRLLTQEITGMFTGGARISSC